jgi:hypothetical protein
MVKDPNSLLGELLHSYPDNLHTYENGIVYYDDYLLWDEIEQIFIRWKITNRFYIPFEDRMIRLIDSSCEREIKIYFSSMFFMKKGKSQLFNHIYSYIINKIVQRQLKQFIEKINAGKGISYKYFKITREALFIRETNKSIKKIDNKNIIRCDSENGALFIVYLEPNSEINKSFIGTIEDTPNIHVLQTYIDSI